jgi:DNA-binding CsgD family transcriptional regulator
MDETLRELLMKLSPPTEIPKKTYAEEKAEWESFFPEIPYPVAYNPMLEPSQSSKPVILPSPDPFTIEAGKWLNLIKHPCVVLILGSRGKGKSALGYRILEYHRWGARKIYVVGLPREARKILPDWIGMVACLDDAPVNSIVLVDEAYIPYHARSGTTVEAKAMSRAINLSRQREQTIIFVTQESRQIDKNIVSSPNLVVYKDPGMLQLKFDRRELKELATQANQAFTTISGDKRKWSFAYDQNSDFTSLIENSLPTFWNEKLSHVFAADGETITRAPKKALLSQRIEKAKEFAKQGLSQGEISKMMGVSRPTVGNWLKGYPYKR